MLMPERIQHLISDFCQVGAVYFIAIFISLQKFSNEFYIDAVGSTIAGAGLIVTIIGTRA